MWLVAHPWHTLNLQPASLLSSTKPVAPAGRGVFKDDRHLPNGCAESKPKQELLCEGKCLCISNFPLPAGLNYTCHGVE